MTHKTPQEVHLDRLQAVWRQEPITPAEAIARAVRFVEGADKDPFTFLLAPLRSKAYRRPRRRRRRAADARRTLDGDTLFRCWWVDLRGEPSVDVRALRVEVGDLLRSVVSGADTGTRGITISYVLRRPKIFSGDSGALASFLASQGRLPSEDERIAHAVERAREPDRYRLAGLTIERGGALRDLYLYRLIHVLELAGVDKLRMCPETRCGQRLFIKVRGQRFCSTTCQRRAYMRTQRAEERRRRQQRIQRGGKRHGQPSTRAR